MDYGQNVLGSAFNSIEKMGSPYKQLEVACYMVSCGIYEVAI